MAKKRKSRSNKAKPAGSMMAMRSGFRGAVGQGRKRKKGEVTFGQVLGLTFGVAFIFILIWQLTSP